MIYDLMGWDTTKRYKIIGFLIEVDGEKVFLFDMTMTENFDATRKRKKKTLEEATQSEGEQNETLPAQETKTPSVFGFSDNVTATFGDTVEEDLARKTQVIRGFFEVERGNDNGSK